MLQLKDIKKNYEAGNQTFIALNGIDLNFKKNEFVSILGASGSGKTTLLNIIGGLDRYTSGDLIVNEKSTKNFRDNDWDAYRNSTIGFVFQSYNLITHLSVLDNVEMALRLSGINASERKEKAKKVLFEVGLADHIYKRPNQLSGGQMQRVAIARALVNNPAILLADEPTGALDSHTSKQIMELIQEIAKDRLVIMVTHNADIAVKYSDRIIRLVDGKVVEDSRPVTQDVDQLKNKFELKKVSMSFLTAIKTSFNNLLTKKVRTLITTIAGSIGIIGVALVLSLSEGMTNYVNDFQSDTLAGFPISVSSVVATERFGPGGGDNPFTSTAIAETEFPEESIVYAYDPSSSTTLHTNVIDDSFINYLGQMDSSLYNSISYTRAISMNIIAESEIGTYSHMTTASQSTSMFGSSQVMNEIPDNPEFVQSQYDILAGTYPITYQELLMVVDSNNRVSISTLTALGYSVEDSYSFDDFIGKELKVIPNNVYYQSVGNIFVQGIDYERMYIDEQAVTLTITGIVRVNQDATSEILSTGLGYTTMLTDYMLGIEQNSDIVSAQLKRPTMNVLSGLPFNTQVTYNTIIKMIGGDASPTSIQIYPVSFESKDVIKDYLDAYNIDKTVEQTIIYTDTAETISSTISGLINTITIVLTALAGVSLVVSSIMIGIITYVSVVERTKEIGIMRSLGARKKDISRIFNAETLLIGLSAGLFGIVVTWLLAIPANSIIYGLIQIEDIVVLTMSNALILVLLSAVLTLVAGFIPSRLAAKKDPVNALRTE
jgi:putative ABC transport system permease protein